MSGQRGGTLPADNVLEFVGDLDFAMFWVPRAFSRHVHVELQFGQIGLVHTPTLAQNDGPRGPSHRF